MRPDSTLRAARGAVVGALLVASGLTAVVSPGAAQATPTKAPSRSGLPAGSPAATAADRAATEARATGRTVPIPAATTATSTLAANPDGTFQLDQYAQPVRKRVGGTWKKLDASLVKNADGTYSPAVATSRLVLSGGGTGPMATMTAGDRKLALTAPMRLPTPTAAGDTLTYRNVLSGVDLRARADDQGGFNEVLVVHDAKAAADPRLADLAFATSTRGLTLDVDQSGNITARDAHGRAYLSAPAPTMWDSATPTSERPTATDSTGATVDAATGDPVASTAAGAGLGAHTATLRASKRGDALHLVPDQALLKGAGTVYPVYIDPYYPAGGGLNAWTYVATAWPTTSYYKNTGDPRTDGGLRVGYNGWESPTFLARAFLQFTVDPRLYGAALQLSTLYITDSWSATCTDEPLELWHSSGIYPSTTWNSSITWYERLDTKNFHGYHSGCNATTPSFNALGLMATAAADGYSLANFGFRAPNESDRNQWKRMDPSTAHLTTNFDHAPDTPGPLTTSPATACSGGSTVGNGDVILNSYVSDPEPDTLGVTITATNTATGATLASSNGLTAYSGTTASLRLTQPSLTAAAGGKPIGISWKTSVTDYLFTTTSTTCSFTFDPIVPGAPAVTSNATSFTVGTAANFTFTPNSSDGAPGSYRYQLNSAPPVTVAASGTTPVTVSLKPTSRVDTLTVQALSAGGNIGAAASYDFTAAAPAAASDNDLTGDGIADSLTVGGGNNVPKGLWLGRGTRAPGPEVTASNLGVNGQDPNTADKSATWTGDQVITGHFAHGGGFNDVITYNPANGTGALYYGNGDGSPLSPVSGSEINVDPSTFTLKFDDGTTNYATSIANAGNLSGGTTGFPDLLVVVAGSLYLEPSDVGPASFSGLAASVDLSDTDPPGTGTWAGWTITTALVNGLPVLYARDTASGALWYYPSTSLRNLRNGQPATSVQVAASGWTAAAKPVLQAADINGDGTVDLWATTSAGTQQASLATVSGGTVTLAASATQVLNTAGHSWALNDAGSGQVTTATDSGGGLSVTGNAGTRWNSGDLFDPDVAFDGKTGVLAATGPAVATNDDFSVSAWVRPDALGGVIASQDGTHSSGFTLYPDRDNRHWYFCLSRSDGTGSDYDCAVTNGITTQLKVWTQVTATYKASTGRMSLYVNGIDAGTATHWVGAAWNATGAFRVGDYLSNSQHVADFAGQIAGVQTWRRTLTPLQVATLSSSPFQTFLPDDTNYPLGSSWTLPGGRMRFWTRSIVGLQANYLSFEDPAGNSLASFGGGKDPSAVITMQSDGNFAMYPTATHTIGSALWSTNTAGHPNAVALYQADGNFAVLDDDGTILRHAIPYQAATVDAGTGLCLDSNTSGQVYTGGCNGGDYQQWTYQADGTIVNKATGLCLDSNSSGQVYTLDCNGDGYQSWTTPVSSGTVADFQTNLCLDSNSSGQAYTGGCNGGAFQTWNLSPPA